MLLNNFPNTSEVRVLLRELSSVARGSRPTFSSIPSLHLQHLRFFLPLSPLLLSPSISCRLYISIYHLSLPCCPPSHYPRCLLCSPWHASVPVSFWRCLVLLRLLVYGCLFFLLFFLTGWVWQAAMISSVWISWPDKTWPRWDLRLFTQLSVITRHISSHSGLKKMSPVTAWKTLEF